MGRHHHHHHHHGEKAEKLDMRVYFRLLGYAKKYWKRLTIGLLAGFLVGGSLLAGLLMLPEMVESALPAENNKAIRISAGAGRVLAAVENDADWKKLSADDKLRAIELAFDPSKGAKDPKLVKMLEKMRSYAKKFNLPVVVGDYDLTISYPRKTVVPLIDRNGKLAWQVFAFYALFFIVAWVIKNVASYVNHYCMRSVGAKVVSDMREEIFRCLTRQSLAFYGSNDVGQLISRCTTDTSSVESAVAESIADATRSPVEIAACITAMVIISVEYGNFLSLAVLLIGMPFLLLPLVIISRKIRTIYRNSFRKIADVTSRMHEVFTGIMVVKAYNMEEAEQQGFHRENRKYLRTVIKALRIQLLMEPLTETVSIAGALVFLIYAYSKGVTITQLSALMAPAILAYQPIKKLAKLVTSLQRSMAGADRYFEIIDTHTELPEKADGVQLTKFENAIEFKDVVFGYTERNIIDGVSFSIPKGSLVAVVGSTGSGKTTIANLIARFYDVRSGSVTIDGVDVRDCDVKSLRRLIGIVNQDPLLFNTSIADNISYGCPEATREDVIKAATEANADNFITDGRHKEQYDTIVGEKGFLLSGGEKQRVAIARAILKNPPILILDEATSALDTVTERMVQNALNRVMSNRTVFAIAHRLSTIKNANQIIVLDKGRIVEQGTHDELLQLGGVYKKLHDTQFEKNVD